MLQKEVGEVDDEESFQELSGEAVHAFRTKYPNIRLFDDDVMSRWDSA